MNDAQEFVSHEATKAQSGAYRDSATMRNKLPSISSKKELNMTEEMKYFCSMRAFLENYWNMGEQSSDDIGNLLSSLEPVDDQGMPRDIALWDDWMLSIAEISKPRL